MTQGWPHLEKLKDKLAPKLDCDVGVLIGYDCSKALDPREVVSAGPNKDGPFALKTDLGWGIVGVISGSIIDNSDQVGLSHRMVSHRATDSQITLQKTDQKLWYLRQTARSGWTKIPRSPCKGATGGSAPRSEERDRKQENSNQLQRADKRQPWVRFPSVFKIVLLILCLKIVIGVKDVHFGHYYQ